MFENERQLKRLLVVGGMCGGGGGDVVVPNGESEN